MGAVTDWLKANGVNRAVLIPTGLLALLSLHAAWTPDASKPTGRRYAMDEIEITYAPSAHAYHNALERADCPVQSTMIVDNPDESLLFATEESAAVAAHFAQASTCWLMCEAASKAHVIEEMQKANLIHFATHGFAGFDKPLDGYLLMAERQELTLREMMQLHLSQTRLAVLSACETGILGTDLLDEVVSLPSGLMQAGVPGVIGSLWSVSDASTMMLMARFYDLWRGEGLQPPEALRQAQMWLRDTTNGEKETYFKRSLPEYQGMRMPEASAREALNQMFLNNPDERSFAHPFYWAAFGYTGV